MATVEQRLTAEVNRIFQQLVQDDPSWGRFLTVQPAYRYFPVGGTKDRCFWTTEPVQHNGKSRFASGIYRYLKTRNRFKLTQERYHARRKDAKARALKLANMTAKRINGKGE
jgi:hypothetical protein